MPKQKTHKGMSKKLNKRPSGTITIGKPGSNHNTGKKPRKFNRDCRKGNKLSKSDEKRLKTVIY